MSVDFGFALIEKHPRPPRLNQWMEDVDAILPRLQGHYRSLWMTDHFIWGDQYVYDVWTVLTWLAAKWPAFEVGPMVMGQNYRNPALLAKMAATLSVFSGGRLILGLGAGWKEDEYRAYGYEYPSAGARVEQLEDTLEIIRRLWTQPGKVSYQGTHYSINDAYFEPKPDPLPTICLGVKGEKSLRLAARYADWWNISDAPIDYYTDRSNLLSRYCEEIGRDPQSVRRSWFGRVVTARTEAEVQKLATSRPGIVYSRANCFIGTPEQVVEQMAEFVAAGNTYFMIDVVGQPNTELLDLVNEEIIPRVRAL